MGMSKCLSRKIGAILVKDNRVIATGYNGPPSGVPHCDYRAIDVAHRTAPYTDHFVAEECPRRRLGIPSGEGLEICPAVHAEINPIMQAARMGISTNGATLYCYCGTPCINCAKEIIQSSIKRVVCLARSGDIDWDTPIKDGDNPEKKEYNFPLSQKLFELAGVELDIVTEEEIE
jgi:dCMP deaminase